MQEKRQTFTFYYSFYDAIKDLPDSNQLEIYRAIFELSFNENEVELSGMSSTIFKLIKPQLLANIKKYHNGKNGAEKKKTESKTKAKRKQNESKIESCFSDPESKPQANINININKNTNTKENVNKNINEEELSIQDQLFSKIGKVSYQEAKEMMEEEFQELFESESFKQYGSLLNKSLLIKLQGDKKLTAEQVRFSLDNFYKDRNGDVANDMRLITSILSRGEIYYAKQNNESQTKPTKNMTYNEAANIVLNMSNQELENYNKKQLDLSNKQQKDDLVYEIITDIIDGRLQI